MTIIEILLKEIEQEVITTRKMLSIVPNDKYDWRPHAKSMKIQQLVTHIAELPAWITMALTTDGLDFATMPYEPSKIDNTADVLEFLEGNYADAHALLAKFDESLLSQPWVLRNGDTVLADMNRYETVRISISQTIHHRAQLGVYLRLLNIPIPGSYGPSADELEQMKQYA